MHMLAAYKVAVVLCLLCIFTFNSVREFCARWMRRSAHNDDDDDDGWLRWFCRHTFISDNMPLPLLYDRTMTFSRTCTQKRIYVFCVMLCLSTTPAGLTKLRIATIQYAISALLCCADYAASMHTHTGRQRLNGETNVWNDAHSCHCHNTQHRCSHVPHTAQRTHHAATQTETLYSSYRPQNATCTQNAKSTATHRTNTHTHTGAHVHHAQTNESN